MATKKSAAKAGLDVEGVLANWNSLNAFLKECGEDDAKALLDAETGGRCRQQYVLRIHGR